MGYQTTGVTWETRGEVGCRAKGPRRTLDRMRSRAITRDMGEFRAEGPNGRRKDTGLGVTRLWNLGEVVVGEAPWDTDKIVMWKA